MTYSTLITVAQLKPLVGKDTVILDCRFDLSNPKGDKTDQLSGRQQYQKGHLPGAYYFDLNEDLSGLVTQASGRHPLPDFDILAQKLSCCGVFPSTQIVLYDNSRGAFAARAWWLLRHMGFESVAVLDGGFNAWVKANQAIDRRQPSPRQGHSSLPIQYQNPVTHLSELKKSLFGSGGAENTCLVDARESKRYLGIVEPIDAVAGHIPTALNAPWQEATSEEGFFYSRDIQKARWEKCFSQNNDSNAESKVIHYCGSGVTACVNILSMVIAGYPFPTLYPGSWSEWSCFEELPIEGESH
ncbi:sulfurtransferase [Marinibactrum halimedae]|nr:sulfurtransferase [Marinibactrum halimedae]MCD9460085.1 sulfurtransferase [Marinibactrum halimedae]